MATAKAVDTLAFLIDAAFQEGCKAYWRGIDWRDNPYDSDRQRRYHEAWLDGWREQEATDR